MNYHQLFTNNQIIRTFIERTINLLFKSISLLLLLFVLNVDMSKHFAQGGNKLEPRKIDSFKNFFSLKKEKEMIALMLQPFLIKSD